VSLKGLIPDFQRKVSERERERSHLYYII